MTQLQPLLEDLPELLGVSAGGQGHVRQIDGDHALVEAAIVLVLAGLVISGVGNVADPGIGKTVRGQEGAAPHTGVHVALELLHLLLGDIVRHHPPGGAFGGQLRQIPVGGVLVDVVLLQGVDQLGEGGGHPHALLILHALVPLQQHLLDDHGQVLLLPLVPGLVQVHEHCDKGGLSVGGQKGHHLILDGLHAPADLLPQAGLHQLADLLLAGVHADGRHLRQDDAADLLAADLHKGGQVGQTDGLAAVLVGGHLGHDLGGDVAGGGEGMGLFDHGAGDNGAVLQHVLQVHQVAVVHMLGEIVGVVEVDDALLMGLHNILGQQQTVGNIPGHLAGHIIPLGGVHHGIFVGVLLLGLLVVALDEGENLVVGGVGLAHQGPGIAVGDVVLGHLKGPVGHDVVLHHVLNLLHGGGAVHLLALQLHGLGDAPDLHRGHAVGLGHRVVGLGDGHLNFLDIEGNLSPVALDDLHVYRLSFLLIFSLSIAKAASMGSGQSAP